MGQNLTIMTLALSSTTWRDRLLLISPFFFWGTAMVAMKGVIPETSPFFLAALRILPAGFLVLLTAIVMGHSQPKSWKAWLWIALFGLVDGTLFQGFLALGLQKTSAGLGSVMIDSQPLAVAVLALVLYGEKVGGLGWLGLLLGVAGISLIGLTSAGVAGIDLDMLTQFSLPDLGQLFIQGLNQGEILMLLAALSMAVGTVMIRKVCQHADAVTATGWHLVIGGIPLLLGSLCVESNQMATLTMSHWGAIAYSSVFGSAIAYGLFFFFASTGNLTSLSSLTFLTPVFALIFGNIILGEVLNPIQFFGVLVTLISIFLVNQRDTLVQRWKKSELSLKEKLINVLPLSPDITRTATIRVPIKNARIDKVSTN